MHTSKKVIPILGKQQRAGTCRGREGNGTCRLDNNRGLRGAEDRRHTEIWSGHLLHVFGMGKWRDSLFILKGDASLMQEPQIEIELPSGSCMLFKKELMDKIQIFDPNTFLYYEEDIIFKEEEKIGLKNYLIPCLRCIHLGASSTEKSKTIHSSVVLFYLDSASYYLKKYGNLSLAQRMVLPFARLSMLAKIKLIRIIEKRRQ